MAKKKNNSFSKQETITPSNFFKYPIHDSLAIMPNLDYPVFCFKHIHKRHSIGQCDAKELSALVTQMTKLSQIGWKEIYTSSRKGMGWEKIQVSSLNVKPPKFITGDVQHLYSLRFLGNKPFLVHRNKFICHVIFIDNKFSVYDH